MFNLFRVKTFTDDWIKSKPLQLSVDIQTSTFCGKPLGTKIEAFSFLGKTENPKAVKELETLYYYSAGIALGFDAVSSAFCDLRIVWEDVSNEGFTPFAGTIHYGNQTLASLEKENIVSILGEPYGAHRDEEEELLFYDTPHREWQFEFTLDGKLKQLILTHPPILEDEFQRECYGITQPWPPPQ
ncbi:hypothetical protein P0Y35_13085 [Kiritimatiellaeota bacterium B1221]|nr:hypothetical protein [Kiritimatiellaeota bacterium B1221]